MGRTVLSWWPDDGWPRGTVARLCPRRQIRLDTAESAAHHRRRSVASLLAVAGRPVTSEPDSSDSQSEPQAEKHSSPCPWPAPVPSLTLTQSTA